VSLFGVVGDGVLGRGGEGGWYMGDGVRCRRGFGGYGVRLDWGISAYPSKH
jgi:hypothetical protein